MPQGPGVVIVASWLSYSYRTSRPSTTGLEARIQIETLPAVGCAGLRLPSASVLHIHEPEWAGGVRSHPTIQHSINHVLDEIELLALEKHAVKDNADISPRPTVAFLFAR